jgi:hypothetical protein
MPANAGIQCLSTEDDSMFFKKFIAAGLALWPMAGLGQPADPADAAAPVPVVHYDSVFAGYTAWREQAPGDWREHNDETGRLGGHAGHLKSANDSPGEPQDGAHDHKGHQP